MIFAIMTIRRLPGQLIPRSRLGQLHGAMKSRIKAHFHFQNGTRKATTKAVVAHGTAADTSTQDTTLKGPLESMGAPPSQDSQQHPAKLGTWSSCVIAAHAKSEWGGKPVNAKVVAVSLDYGSAARVGRAQSEPRAERCGPRLPTTTTPDVADNAIAFVEHHTHDRLAWCR